MSHTWPKRFQYVIFVSKYKQNALMEPLFHLNHGYACSSGRKLSMPGRRYTTLESLMFDKHFVFGVPVNWSDAKTSRGRIGVYHFKVYNMKQLRAAAEKEPELVDAVLDSMSPVKIYYAAIEVWNSLHSIDTTLKFGHKDIKGSFSSHPSLKDFLDHCCQQRYYSFCVKKCGDDNCNICKSPHIPP